MSRTTALLLVCLAAHNLAFAQLGTEVKIKLPKGSKWTVEQTVEVQADTVNVDGESAGKSADCPDIRLLEHWTDESLDAAAGIPSRIRRTFTTSSLSDPAAPAAATLTEKAVLVLEREGSKVNATTGSPDAGTLDALGHAPPEAMEVFLPAKAVKKGDSWVVKEEAVVGFFDAIGASIAGAQGDDAENIKDRYAALLSRDDGSFCEGAELKVTLVEVAKGEATIRFGGKRTLAGGGSATVAGGNTAVAQDGEVEIEGLFKINVSSGRPVQLEITISQVEYSAGRVQICRGVVEVLGVKESWKIRRTWAPAK